MNNPKERNPSLSSPVFYRDWSQTIDRLWQGHLTPFEFAIIRFIFDRTVGWGKEWERIPLRHFTEGVISKDDKCHGRSCLKPTAVKAALASLSEKGAILIQHESNCNHYSLNYEWTPMKTPKRLKTAEKEDSLSWSDGDYPVGRVATNCKSRGDHHKRDKGKSLRKPQDAATADAVDVSSGRGEMKIETRAELEASLKKVESASRAKRDAKKQDGKLIRGDSGRVPSLSAMRRIWADFHSAHCKQVPHTALPNKSLFMLQSYAKEWNLRHEGVEWVDFLGWVFENWDAITRTSFRWMSPKPICPDPHLVASAKLRVYLEDGWNHRETIRAIYALPPREREIRFLMLERGMSREVAEKWATARKDQDAKIDELAAEHRKLEVAKKSLALERTAMSATARRIKDQIDRRSSERAGLNAMTEEDEASIEEGMRIGLRKRLAADAKEREKEEHVKAPSPKIEIPMSFPKWD